ncbi:DNA polymerase domain-containing protein [Labilithrix luteola]|nr:hypothetical protein [Labilithrix luteola]
MVAVSNADRVVFPEVGRTKGEVVSYYERIAPRLLVHATGRPLSIRRFPKGLAGAGFFQKNVPDHYPASIERFTVSRSPRSNGSSRARAKKDAKPADVTIYPLVSEPEHLAYLANQGAIELHVTTSRAADLLHPDRIVIDLDPPKGALALVRKAALIARDALGEFGLDSIPVATGSKGYHVVAPIVPSVDLETLGLALQKFGALVAAKFPDELTTAFRIAERGKRVFVDWLRNRPLATVVSPYSLRATPRASVATPFAWSELEVVAPDTFTIDDLDRLLERGDPLAALAETPGDASFFVSKVDDAFDASGLVLEPFDRFRS